MSNNLPMAARVDVVSALIEGNGLRPTYRIFKVAKSTILRLIVAVGTGCLRLHNRLVRNVAAPLIEADEQWSFCFKKEKRVTPDDPEGYGDIWTFSAECVLTRLIIYFAVGKRDQETADAFVADLRSRITMLPQINTDGLSLYVKAMAASFDAGRSVNYGQVVKTFSGGPIRTPDHKYEPPRDPFITKQTVFGAPDVDLMSTSHLERYHLTARHINGRKRRLCLYFSKKPENHRASEALSVFAYNFCKVHGSFDKRTPAMAAGLTDHVWSVEELVAAALAEPPAEAPAPQPLTLPATRSGAAPVARPLPGGGWLRLVGGHSPSRKGAPLPAPPTPPADPPPPQAPIAAVQAPAVDQYGQLDLFEWHPRHAAPSVTKLLPPPGTQLELF